MTSGSGRVIGIEIDPFPLIEMYRYCLLNPEHVTSARVDYSYLSIQQYVNSLSKCRACAAFQSLHVLVDMNMIYSVLDLEFRALSVYAKYNGVERGCGIQSTEGLRIRCVERRRVTLSGRDSGGNSSSLERCAGTPRSARLV